MINSNSGVELEAEAKDARTVCKEKFAECKKLEDGSIGYIAKCYTSAENLNLTLTSLKVAEDKLEKVTTKIDMILNGTAR